MLVYIAMRFKFAFAVGAVIALFHDALAVLACFLIINRPIDIDVVAAILAVLGYSINDTIVIFTQIRKNLIVMKGQALDVIVDTSINQTLRNCWIGIVIRRIIIQDIRVGKFYNLYA